MQKHTVTVYGKTVDSHTRCVHYHNTADIVAIKFKCCGKFYPCYKCHAECETHPITRWPKKTFGEQAILCGMCGNTLSIFHYMAAERCPHCASAFNAGCRKHYGIYFDVSVPQKQTVADCNLAPADCKKV